MTSKTCTKCSGCKPTDQFYTQKRSKDGLTAWCKDCKKLYMRKWTSDNKESENKRIRRWYRQNRDLKNSQNKLWNSQNKATVNAATAKRRSSRLMACPNWLTKQDLDIIANFYKEARKLTELTGIEHQVDHILPLQGKQVCGLHVPWNLQILTKSNNLSKGNRLKR